MDEYLEKYQGERRIDYPCMQIPPSPAVEQAEFFGKFFCGTQGGKSFQDATRPNLEGVCPEGTTVCSKNTSAENTICSKNLVTCPITSIEFTKTRPSGSEYTVVSTGVDGYLLVYSKTAKD